MDLDPLANGMLRRGARAPAIWYDLRWEHVPQLLVFVDSRLKNFFSFFLREGLLSVL